MSEFTFVPFAPHATDVYKVGHAPLYPDGTEFAYSNFTPRSVRHFVHSHSASKLFDDKVVVFGTTSSMKEVHAMWQTTFFDVPKDVAVARYKRRMDKTLGKDVVDVNYIASLHDLGFLPVAVLSINEGERVGVKIPVYVIYSTIPGFYWVVNYLETVLSSFLWKRICNATIAYEYRRVFEHFAALTGAPKSFILYQGHDFSYRGMDGTEAAARASSGHLMMFRGTDTIPAIDYVEQFYPDPNSDDPIGESVVATEHAVATSNILSLLKARLDAIHATPEDVPPEVLESIRLSCEMQYIIDTIVRKVPRGIVSLVCDSFDFWGVIRNLPMLKEHVLSRGPNENGLSKVVIRPDSGDPVNIITGYKLAPQKYADAGDMATSIADPYEFEEQYEVCQVGDKYYKIELQYVDSGNDYEQIPEICITDEVSIEEVKGAIECMWEVFGGTTNEKGFKVLSDRIGLIYGDSISVARQWEILERLMNKGFASNNVVLGIGSYSYQYNTRDTFGMAIKATAISLKDRLIELYKDPATADSEKKSACGLLKVIKDERGEYKLLDRQKALDGGELTLMYRNGTFFKNPAFTEIRGKIDATFA